MTEENLFSTTLQVTVGDVNYGAHVGNDRFLLFFHEARIRFLTAKGLSELDIGGGIGLIMSEAHVKYRAQVSMGEELEVTVRISEMGRVRFVIDYQITKKSDGAVAAEGQTMMGGFDYENNRIAALPSGFIDRFS